MPVNQQPSFTVKRLIATVVGAIVGLLLITSACSSATTVSAGSVGVVTKLGEIQDNLLSEGFTMRTPFITRVHEFNLRSLTTDATASAGTSDLQQTKVEYKVVFTIKRDHVLQLFREVGDTDQITQTIIIPAAVEDLKQNTPKFSAEQLIVNRAQVKDVITKSLGERLAAKGVILQDFVLVDIDFNTAYNKAILDKQLAAQQAEAAKFLKEKATNEAAAAIETAKGEATASIERAKGQSEANRLMQSALTESVLRRLFIEKWDGHFPQVMGDNKLLMNLPGVTKETK